MKKMMNFIAGYATAVMMAIFMVASVLSLTGCETGIDDVVSGGTPCTDCGDNNPDPDPEKTVKEVNHISGDCPVQNIVWSEKNATLTRGEKYTVSTADGGAYANVLLKYNATIVYSDGTTQAAAPEYTINAAAVAFGYRDTLYVAADKANLFDADPTQETRETSNGTVTFLDWGEGSKIAFLASASKSVSSLTIAGVTKTDLCDIVVSYEYESTNVRTVKEEENYFVKVAAISGTVIVDNESRTLTIERPLKVAKEGGSILPPDGGDKEVVDYDIINEKLNGDSWSGDLSEIWSDGSTTTVGTLNYTRSHSFEAPADKEVKVSELSYSKSSASKAENIRTGEVKNDSQYGCTITLTGMKNTLTMRTNRGTMTFAGYWEYPTIVLPNGKEFQPQYCAAELSEKSISDNGISGNRLPINFKANGTYGSESKELSSTLTLVKVESGEGGDGGEDDFIISAYGEDFHEEGDYIKWTLVTVYNKDGESREPMAIARNAGMNTDSRKATANRTYDASNPGLTEVRRTGDTEYNYSFDNVEYTSTWTYADFSHKVTVSGRENIYYHIDGFDILVWNEKFSVSRVGVELGVNPIKSTETSETYLDLINYSLFNGGSALVTKAQEVEYTKYVDTKPDEDVVSYNVEKIGVKADKLYYNEIENHSINTELNKSVEKSVNLVYTFGVAACGDWTVTEGEATGITLNVSSFNYTTAKNYIFGSNRGDNVATASLQTSYPVSYMGNTYTLTITGTVTGVANKTASTTNSNTYTFTGKLFADGVEIASESDSAVETIEKKEEPEKDYIEALSFDCTIGVTDSDYAGIVIVAHYADGTHVASNGATSSAWGNTLVNGQIGTLETVGNVYSWNGGYVAVPMQDFIYNGYDSPYVGCTSTDNGDGTYTVTSNRGGVTYTFPKRSK